LVNIFFHYSIKMFVYPNYHIEGCNLNLDDKMEEYILAHIETYTILHNSGMDHDKHNGMIEFFYENL